jgi:adenosylcobinamide-GDP ribazoletransferase
MKQQWRLWLIAIQFFTRLPLPTSLMHKIGFDPDWISRCVRFFPLVGVLVGSTIGGCFYVLANWLPQGLAIAIALTLGVLMTGAFHEDGFADYCDGFGGHHSTRRTIEIMRDSRIGVYGALGLVLLFSIKLAALTSLNAITLVFTVLAAHPLSRCCAAVVMYALPYVEDQHGDKHGLKPVAARISGAEISFAVLSAVLVLLGVLMFTEALPLVGTAVALCAMASATALFVGQLRARLKGYTGDTLGAIQQITETLFFISITGHYAGPF